MAYVLLILINDEVHKKSTGIYLQQDGRKLSAVLCRKSQQCLEQVHNITTLRLYLFSRNVFALDTFFPMADAFQEKYDPEGST